MCCLLSALDDKEAYHRWSTCGDNDDGTGRARLSTPRAEAPNVPTPRQRIFRIIQECDIFHAGNKHLSHDVASRVGTEMAAGFDG